MAISRFALGLMIVVASSAAAWAGETFVEKDGVVSIEAEHYTDRTGPWYLVQGRNAAVNRSRSLPRAAVQKAVTIRGGAYTDHLRYAIHFTHSGTYRLCLLGSRGAQVDEARVLFRAEDAPSAGAIAFNVTLPETVRWTDEAHSVTVKRPGWHRLLLVRGKSPGYGPGSEPVWRVDKIVLIRGAEQTPSGDGPEETINRGQELLPATAKSIDIPIRDELWELREGYLVLEAEPLRANGWSVKDQPAGFTGAAYVVWHGFDRREAKEGSSSGMDETGVEQGPPDSWLVIRVNVGKAGRYRVNLRNYHSRTQPEIDCWIGKLDINGSPETPIRRSGDSLKDGPGFSWLDWGVQAFDLKEGENTLYVAGRSRGFGIDRIAIYRDGDAAAEAKALNPETRDDLPRDSE